MRLRYAVILMAAGAAALSACGRTAQAPAPAQHPVATQAPAPAPQSSPQSPAPPVGTDAAASVSFSDVVGIFAEQTIKDLAGLGVFDSTTGEFKPTAPITRAEFVRWLIKANNAYYKDTPEQQIRLAESGAPTFADVPASNPDFKYIQGMANAGFVIGTDATHFTPDRPITREEMIAIKASRDEHGMNMGPVEVMFIHFTDADKISKVYTGAIHEDDSARASHNIARVWGSIKTFNPQMSVTRAEAALCLGEFGGEIPDVTAAKASGRVK